jgi:hypothetical protein
MAVACLASTLASLPAQANAVRTFHFNCNLGPKMVQITTEGASLVYHYGPRGKPELTIREEPATPNVFYRHEALGSGGEGQQLRFVKGQYSYVLSSQFIAIGISDEVKFFVLRDDKVLFSRNCRSAPSFEDYDQFDHLPRDTLELLRY